MSLKFWRNSQDMQLPAKVRATLASQFKVDDELLGRLRCVVKPGRYVTRPVECIVVFDPSLVEGGISSIHSYQDMKKHKYAILFDGHIDKRKDYIYLSDNRPVAHGLRQQTSVVASIAR